MTPGLRDEAMRREGYVCAACRAAPATEFDHFRGRARDESLEFGWCLCSSCHRAKTDNVGGRIEWLCTFARHCAVHRYFDAMRWALKEIQWVCAKKGVA